MWPPKTSKKEDLRHQEETSPVAFLTCLNEEKGKLHRRRERKEFFGSNALRLKGKKAKKKEKAKSLHSCLETREAN